MISIIYKVSILLQLKREKSQIIQKQILCYDSPILIFCAKKSKKKKETTLETGFPKPQIICIKICVIKCNPMSICVPALILAIEMLVNMSQHLIITKYNIRACYYLEFVV